MMFVNLKNFCLWVEVMMVIFFLWFFFFKSFYIFILFFLVEVGCWFVGEEIFWFVC